MNKLIIIRGLPGSGKTTIAKSVPNAVICEADSYMIDSFTGNYRFDPNKLRDCHRLCLERARQALEAKRTVVVSNTSIRLWELEPYFALAAHFNVPVHVFKAVGNYQNIHNVSYNTIKRMRTNYEPYSGEIVVETKG